MFYLAAFPQFLPVDGGTAGSAFLLISIHALLNVAWFSAMVLLFVGGALYSIGGILYALRWPDPWPTTFGYHEFFHACTAVAAICHYIAMWFVVF